MRSMEAFHHTQYDKSKIERSIADLSELNENYPDQWDIMADKGY